MWMPEMDSTFLDVDFRDLMSSLEVGMGESSGLPYPQTATDLIPRDDDKSLFPTPVASPVLCDGMSTFPADVKMPLQTRIFSICYIFLVPYCINSNSKGKM